MKHRVEIIAYCLWRRGKIPLLRLEFWLSRMGLGSRMVPCHDIAQHRPEGGLICIREIRAELSFFRRGGRYDRL